MKPIKLLLLFAFISTVELFAQQPVEFYTAKSYWHELNKKEYRYLLEKMNKGETLTQVEEIWHEQYTAYLKLYYNNMVSIEKATFQNQKDQWYDASGLEELISGVFYDYPILTKAEPIIKNQPVQDNETITLDNVENQNYNLLLKHMLFSAPSGATYGILFNNIFGFNEKQGSWGVPFITAGASIFYPLFSKKFKDVNNNSVWLRFHGKSMGGIFGASLGMTLFGSKALRASHYYEYYDIPVWDGNGYTYIETQRNKINNPGGMVTRASIIAGSLLGGHFGFKIGREKGWSEGKASMFQYYGYAIPAATTAMLFAFEADQTRVYGSGLLASIPIGYYVAHKVTQKNDYSRGDVTAITNTSAIGGLYGIGLMLLLDFDDNPAILLPLSTAIGGSIVGHKLQSNFHLSRQQGRRLDYVSLAGACIGLGFTGLLTPDNEGFYALVPAITSSVSFALLHKYYRNNPEPLFSANTKKEKDLFFSVHPENILIANIAKTNYIPPLATFSMRF